MSHNGQLFRFAHRDGRRCVIDAEEVAAVVEYHNAALVVLKSGQRIILYKGRKGVERFLSWFENTAFNQEICRSMSVAFDGDEW